MQVQQSVCMIIGEFIEGLYIFWWHNTDASMQQIRGLFYPCFQTVLAGNRALLISVCKKLLNLGLLFTQATAWNSICVCIFFYAAGDYWLSVPTLGHCVCVWILFPKPLCWFHIKFSIVHQPTTTTTNKQKQKRQKSAQMHKMLVWCYFLFSIFTHNMLQGVSGLVTTWSSCV